MTDFIFLIVGYVGMLASAKVSKSVPSVWNPLIDPASFIIGGSLIVTQPVNSWARRVGMLQVGVHLAQLVQTNSSKNP